MLLMHIEVSADVFTPVFSFLLCLFLSPWRVVRSYRPHLDVRDPIGDEVFGVFLSHKVYARRSVPSPRHHLIITFILTDRRD